LASAIFKQKSSVVSFSTSREVEKYLRLAEGGRDPTADAPNQLISHQVFVKSFCKSEFPHKFVNLFLIPVRIRISFLRPKAKGTLDLPRVVVTPPRMSPISATRNYLWVTKKKKKKHFVQFIITRRPGVE